MEDHKIPTKEDKEVEADGTVQEEEDLVQDQDLVQGGEDVTPEVGVDHKVVHQVDPGVVKEMLLEVDLDPMIRMELMHLTENFTVQKEANKNCWRQHCLSLDLIKRCWSKAINLFVITASSFFKIFFCKYSVVDKDCSLHLKPFLSVGMLSGYFVDIEIIHFISKKYCFFEAFKNAISSMITYLGRDKLVEMFLK